MHMHRDEIVSKRSTWQVYGATSVGFGGQGDTALSRGDIHLQDLQFSLRKVRTREIKRGVPFICFPSDYLDYYNKSIQFF